MPTLFFRYNLVPPNVVVVIATRLDMWLERKGGRRGENIPAALSEFVRFCEHGVIFCSLFPRSWFSKMAV